MKRLVNDVKQCIKIRKNLWNIEELNDIIEELTIENQRLFKLQHTEESILKLGYIQCQIDIINDYIERIKKYGKFYDKID